MLIAAGTPFVITPGTSTFTSGSGNFVVPNYDTLVIDLYGSGAAGGSFGTGTIFSGEDGNASTVSTFSLSAGGGKKSTADAGGSYPGGLGGTASGGNTQNTNGGAGGSGIVYSGSFSGGTSGAGGNCPGGGGAGGAAKSIPNSTTTSAGNNGTSPGGGGGGGVSGNTGSIPPVFGGYQGGGSGSFVRHTLTRASGGPAIGSSIAYAVGAQVLGGASAGDGGLGQIKFTWT